MSYRSTKFSRGKIVLQNQIDTFFSNLDYLFRQHFFTNFVFIVNKEGENDIGLIEASANLMWRDLGEIKGKIGTTIEYRKFLDDLLFWDLKACIAYSIKAKYQWENAPQIIANMLNGITQNPGKTVMVFPPDFPLDEIFEMLEERWEEIVVYY